MPRSIFPKDQFQDVEGNALVGASVEIRRESDNTLATVYEARTGGSTIAQPLTTDGNGRIVAYLEASPGGYRVVATLGSLVVTRRHVAVGTVAEHDWPVAAADVTFPTGTGGIEEDNVLDAIAAAAALGGGAIQVWDGDGSVEAAATRVVFNENLTTTALGSGVVRVNAAAAAPGDDNLIGETYGLIHDGTTDQTDAINDVMVTHPFAVFRAPPDATGPLRINGSFDPPNGADVDISRIDIDLGQLGRIFPQGQITETPDENPKIQLAADVAAGATTLFLNLVVAANIDELAADKLLIIRGEKDAAGVAMERDRILIDEVTPTGALTATVTLQEPLQNAYQVEYPGSDWVPGDGADKTRISVAVGSLLTAPTDEGARVLTVADGSLFAAGDFAIVRSLRMVVPDDPGSIPYGEEACRIFSAVGNTITLQESLGRAFATADKAGLYKQDEKRVRIKFGRGRIRAVEAPGSRRIDYIGGQYLTEGSEFVNPRIDTANETHDHEGAGIALRRCYGVRIIDPFVRGRVNEGGGIGNGAFIAYSTRCEVVRGYFERARHGVLFQGGNLNLWWRGWGVANYINGGDFHGAGEFNSRVEDCTFVGGTETAPDSTQQGGVTCGNTRWHAEGRRNRVSGCFFVGFNANSGDFGILVRPAQNGLDLFGNTIISCNRGIGIQHNDQAGPIETRDVILQGTTYRDVLNEVILTGEAPAWAAGQTVLFATAIRPRYRTNAGNLYKTEAGGTTGATPPTHGSSSASDGAISWTYVATAANRITGFVDRDAAGGGGGDVTVQDLREWGSGTAVTVVSSAGVIEPVWATHFDNSQTIHLVRGAGDATAGPLIVRFPAFPGAGRAVRTVQYEETVATMATAVIAVAGVSYINSDGVAVLTTPAGTVAALNLEAGDALTGADFTNAVIASIAGNVITANVAASQEATATVSFVVPGSTIDGQRRINLPERASGALFGMEAKSLPTATALGVVQTTAGGVIAPITKTAAAWTADVTTILAIGQRGLESDALKFKFGNGVDLWSGLAYAGGNVGDVTVQDLREWGSGTAVTVASSAGVITPVWATHFDNSQTIHLVRGAGDATASPLLVRFPAFPGAGRAARTVQYEPTVATMATTPIAVAGVSYVNSDGVAVLSEPAGDPGVFARLNIEEGDALTGADFTNATVASIVGTVITANVAASQEATATVSFIVPGSTIDGQRRINLPERPSGALFGMEAKALPTETTLGVVQTTVGGGIAKFDNAVHEKITTADITGAATVNLVAGQHQRLTLTGNVTSLALSNRPPAGYSQTVLLDLIQDGTGSHTLAWFTGTKFPDGTTITPTSAANAITSVSVTVIGPAGDIIVRSAGLDIKVVA